MLDAWPKYIPTRKLDRDYLMESYLQKAWAEIIALNRRVAALELIRLFASPTFGVRMTVRLQARPSPEKDLKPSAALGYAMAVVLQAKPSPEKDFKADVALGCAMAVVLQAKLPTVKELKPAAASIGLTMTAKVTKTTH